MREKKYFEDFFKIIINNSFVVLQNVKRFFLYAACCGLYVYIGCDEEASMCYLFDYLSRPVLLFAHHLTPPACLQYCMTLQTAKWLSDNAPMRRFMIRHTSLSDQR